MSKLPGIEGIPVSHRKPRGAGGKVPTGAQNGVKAGPGGKVAAPGPSVVIFPSVR